MKKRILSLGLVLAVMISLFVFIPSASAIEHYTPITLPDAGKASVDDTEIQLSNSFILSGLTPQTMGADNPVIHGKFYAFIATDKSYDAIHNDVSIADRGKAPYKFTWTAITEANKRPDGSLDVSKVCSKQGLLFVAGGDNNVTAASLPKHFSGVAGAYELDKFNGVLLRMFPIPASKPSSDFDKVLKFDYSTAGVAALMCAPTTKDELAGIDSSKYEYALDGSSEYRDDLGAGVFPLKPYAQKITLRLLNSPGATKKLTIAAIGAAPAVKPNLKTGTIPFKKSQELFIGSTDPADGGTIHRIPADGKGSVNLAINDALANKDILTTAAAEGAVITEPIPLMSEDAVIWIRNAATSTKPASAWTKIELKVWDTTGEVTSDCFALQNGRKVAAAGGAGIEMWNAVTEKWVAWNYAAAKTAAITHFRLKGTATTWPGALSDKAAVSSMLGGEEILPLLPPAG